MRNSHFFVCSFFALLILTVSSAEAKAAVSPQEYGTLPVTEEVKVSPDGKAVAILETTAGVTSLNIYDINSGAAITGVGFGELKARNILWAGDDYVLLLISATQNINTVDGLKKYEFWRYAALSRVTGKVAYLFSGNPSFGNVLGSGGLIHTLPDNPDSVLMAQYNPRGNQRARAQSSSRIGFRSGGAWSLFEVNLKNGREKISVVGNNNTSDYITDQQGDPILRIEYNSRSEQREIYRLNGQKAELINSYPESEGSGAVFRVHGYTPDGSNLVASAYRDGDTRGLYNLDPETGELREPIFLNPQFDLDKILINKNTGTVFGAEYIEDYPTAKYFDPKYSAVEKIISSAVGTGAISITSASRDRTVWVAEALYTNKPSAFYIYDENSKSISPLGSSRPQLGEKPLFNRIAKSYETDDGLTIHGYLTTPINGPTQNAPTIILPHGGPEGRDTITFDWWAGFYAARGYTVYQPNFRGSDGYGLKFRQAGFGQWGRKMQDDITQGVQKLIDDGVADPDRICIVGASYGGYAALVGATMTSELYACAISINGVSNLITMLGSEISGGEYNVAYWERRIGSQYQDKDDLEASSPELNASRGNTPIMLIHSKEDTVVPIGQSMIMRDALEAANKPHEFISLDGEDHWLSKGKSRVEMLTHSIRFIDTHIGVTQREKP